MKVKETPFTQILTSDKFLLEGNTTVYTALTDVKLTLDGRFYEVIVEHDEGREGYIREKRNDLAYAKKYFVLIE